jgi:hypothetical protein
MDLLVKNPSGKETKKGNQDVAQLFAALFAAR